MKKIFFGVLIVVLILEGTLFSAAGSGRNILSTAAQSARMSRLGRGTMKMRIFEGSVENSAPQAKAVTSSFLQYNLTATVEPAENLDIQSRRIQDIFNLRTVSLLTEADLGWEKGMVEELFHFFRIDDKTYLVVVRPTNVSQRKFRISVFEQNNGTKTNLLDTEVGLPKNISTVFGFRDIKGKPYFISLHILEWKVEGDVPGGFFGGVIGGVEDPIRVRGDIQPPWLIKEVPPRYPEIARQARVDGVVILEATTDINGRVSDLKVLRSIPLLDQAAKDAVRQWVYQPMIVEGKPRGAVFTVSVRFVLSSNPESFPGLSRTAISLLPLDGGGMLRSVRAVQPDYPVEARKAKIEGTVLLEASVDEKGMITVVRVLRPIQPALDKAAADAFKEWTFRPYRVDGKFKAVTVVAYARFWLNPSNTSGEEVGGVAGGVVGGVEGGGKKVRFPEKDLAEGTALPPIRALGNISPPSRISEVPPLYPEAARQSEVDGIVILEVTTDVNGRVEGAKVLRSIPLLDQAAIDAVQQWVYTPLVFEGKPRRCLFTVSVRFTLK